ncbi:armadillo-type protein [Radiomyces spectabilis]|uniref:armadillo-type protein n=1 Tax=Radiomyces spectabilis TaxID=64574 RepID=UPI00221FF3F2|nr:armadillo-type protein [Radiomyces spectabilis]KAI8372980.1 armadillo-type protein [Radiomyces spectabilis]
MRSSVYKRCENSEYRVCLSMRWASQLGRASDTAAASYCVMSKPLLVRPSATGIQTPPWLGSLPLFMEPLHIDHVQKLIEELYSSTDPQTAKQIQEQLQAIQRQPQAWSIASQLLSLPSDHCRFFGAHTFQMKIVREWNSLPVEQIAWLREELLTWIVRLCSGPNFVTTKLCLALISYAFHTIPDHWSQFIPETVNALHAGAQVYGFPASTIQYIILEFLTLVPEEISNADILGGQKSRLIQELKDSIPLVLSTLSSFLLPTDQPMPISMQQKALKCLQSWIQYGIPMEDVYPLLRQCMLFLGHEELFESAVEALLEAMQQMDWAKYLTLRDDLLDCFASDMVTQRFNECIHEEDEDTGKLLARLFCTYGETYTDFVAIGLANPKVNLLMSMIMQLTCFHGHFPVDEEVSDIPLNFWYVLQETLFDNGIIPVRQSVTVTDGDDDVSLERAESEQQALWHRQAGEAALVIYRQLVSTLLIKAAFPEDSVWSIWTKDHKDRFRRYRRDVGDTMINPYFVLRNDMLAIVLDHAVTILNQWQSSQTSSQTLEAAFFCLKSISEEVPTEENTHIPVLFGPQILGRMPSDCDARLQTTTLLLIGSLSEWLKNHPSFLPSVMNYIVPCLSLPRLAPAAASAFADICDACRESLLEALQNLMHVYGAMSSSNIDSNIMQKVVESVADVIQALSPERSVGPLMTLTGDILQGIGKALHLLPENPVLARDLILTQLQYLSACCRGIQPPSDDYQTLSARNSTYDAFASGQLRLQYAKVPGFVEISQAIRDYTQQISTTWSRDEEIARALARFVESGIRSINPLLTLDFEDLSSLVEKSYSDAPYPCWLDIAKFMMTVYGGQEAHYARLRDLLAFLTGKTLAFINGVQGTVEITPHAGKCCSKMTGELKKKKELLDTDFVLYDLAMEEHPDIVDSYFDLLSGVSERIAF